MVQNIVIFFWQVTLCTLKLQHNLLNPKLMKKTFAFFLALTVLTNSFGAFTPKATSEAPIAEQKSATINRMFEQAFKDNSLSYDELKDIATEAKGSKLSFKEKLALKVAKNKFNKKFANGGKSQVVALILVLLVGGLGIHRFYLGYTWQGIVQLLTLGGCGIWALIDLIRIITGSLQPKDGEYETTL